MTTAGSEDVGMTAFQEEEVKTLLIASIKPITTVGDRGNTRRRIGNMQMWIPEVTISHTAMIHRTSTTIHTINISNITKLCAVLIHKRITSGTQSTWQ